MKKGILVISFIITGLVISSIIGCSFVDQNQGTSSINIYLGGSNRSNNFAGAPPTNITSYTLRISGSGMSTINETYAAGTTQISVEVPSGNDRQIELICEIDPAGPSSALFFIGNSTEDLTAGKTVTVSLDMMLNKTKLVFPNPDTQGNPPRIIQLDSLNDASVEQLLLANVNPANEAITIFQPWDLDFDNQGRIYIANNQNSLTDGCVIRIDNFTSPNPWKVAVNGIAQGVQSLSIDRINNYLYYVSSNNILRRTDLSTATFPDIGSVINISNIPGTPVIDAIAVDDDGMLYIADTQTGNQQVVKLDPNDGSVDIYTTDIDFTYNPAGQNQIYAGLMIRDNYLFVGNHGGAVDRIILQLTTDLTFVDGYGTRYVSQPDTAQGRFYGPHFFIGIREDEFYIIDEMGDGGIALDKLVYMEDMDGTNWDYNDSFEFFYDC